MAESLDIAIDRYQVALQRALAKVTSHVVGGGRETRYEATAPDGRLIVCIAATDASAYAHEASRRAVASELVKLGG